MGPRPLVIKDCKGAWMRPGPGKYCRFTLAESQTTRELLFESDLYN